VTTADQGARLEHQIRNPVLPGFHPDPSIVRVGGVYYIATSTFEWYPGVRVHRSTDLAHWEPVGGLLTERSQLDLRGAGDSNGVWAPNLSYADGLFHLLYTDVASFASGFWDPQNYLVTAPEIGGPWSGPVVLHGRGFDASLFHDDGATWMLSMVADWRPGRDRFAGISIQRYDAAERRLVGPERLIFQGTSAGMTEGPNLYRRDGWYYLVTAEGGTSWEHQVTVARSRELFGPYEADPAGPLLTSAGRPDLALQKAGHGSLVETPDGQWFLAHLTARPYTPLGRCVLGRETALQRVTWTAEGWPRIDGGVPAETIPVSSLPAREAAGGGGEETDDFDGTALGPNWSTLRRPATPDWADLTARPSFLRLHGGQSPAGRTRPSLVARRVTATRCQFDAVLEFTPRNYRQLAGVTAYYNTRNWHYLAVTADDDGNPVLDLLTADQARITARPDLRVDLGGATRIGLRVTLDGPGVTFAYDAGAGWHTLAAVLDATILSDEHAAEAADGEPTAWGFTGAFVGLWAQDLGAEGGHADFDRAAYRTW
jgi:xylan 1,4-beta-xylosidase